MALALQAGALAYRGAGSHGAYDVIVSTNSARFLLNVKCNAWAPPHERSRLIDIAGASDVPVLARRRDRKGWDYRELIERDGMGEITSVPPWNWEPSTL